MPSVHYRAADIGGLKLSYREAGPPDAPTFSSAARVSNGGTHVPRFHPASPGQLPSSGT